MLWGQLKETIDGLIEDPTRIFTSSDESHTYEHRTYYENNTNNRLAIQLGYIIGVYFEKRGKVHKDAAENIGHELGFNTVSSTSSFISNLSRGDGYRTLPRKGPRRKLANPNGLKRISILLSYLEADENDEVIQLMKKFYPEFKFPPDIET